MELGESNWRVKMSWLGKVSLGGFPDLDLAGAVTKISESVKNMEKNFDNALGLEENPDNENGDSSNSEGNSCIIHLWMDAFQCHFFF